MENVNNFSQINKTSIINCVFFNNFIVIFIAEIVITIQKVFNGV